MLPGWYGVGQALAAFEDKGLLARNGAGLAVLRGDARQYGDGAGQVRHGHRRALCRAGRGSTRLRDAIFGRIRDGWQQAHDGLLAVTGQSRLLEKHPALDASIRLRLPYIEPLNLLQIELMKRHRAGEDDPRIGEGIQLSINAIATALRNSG